MLEKDPENRIGSKSLLRILASKYSKENLIEINYDPSSIYLGYFYSS